MKKIFQFVLVTSLLAVGVFAQKGTIEPNPQPSLKFAGSQTSAGSVGKDGMVRKNTFAMAGDSDQFSSTAMNIDFVYAGTPDVENGNQVVGGSWSLAIFIDNDYAGSIFGEVVGGTITWGLTQGPGSDIDIIGTRNTQAVLKVLGGTGSFEYMTSGEATFVADTLLDNGVTTGDIVGLRF